jgi:uncharacterized membrane protein YebE (DUF533 family)
MKVKPIKWYDDHISKELLEELTLYRQTAEKEPDGEAFFAREFGHKLASDEFAEEVRNCETKEEKAELYACTEIGCYPFSINMPDSPLSEL